jgi:hypothetical protein
MCPWISVYFPRYYSDVPRFAKSLLILLVFCINSNLNKSYLTEIDHEYDLSLFELFSIDILYNSLLSVSISIVYWVFYRRLYRILWLYDQELKCKSSQNEIKNNDKRKLFDQKLYLKNSMDEIFFDIKQFKLEKSNFEPQKKVKDILQTSNSVQEKNCK